VGVCVMAGECVAAIKRSLRYEGSITVRGIEALLPSHATCQMCPYTEH